MPAALITPTDQQATIPYLALLLVPAAATAAKIQLLVAMAALVAAQVEEEALHRAGLEIRPLLVHRKAAPEVPAPAALGLIRDMALAAVAALVLREET